jgi:nucleoside-diphosphate-sugar epimerase
VGTPLIEMAQAISTIAGSGRIERAPWPAMAEQIETGDFVADLARIRDELGWQPVVQLADGLQRTVSHYQASRA